MNNTKALVKEFTPHLIWQTLVAINQFGKASWLPYNERSVELHKELLDTDLIAAGFIHGDWFGLTSSGRALLKELTNCTLVREAINRLDRGEPL